MDNLTYLTFYTHLQAELSAPIRDNLERPGEAVGDHAKRPHVIFSQYTPECGRVVQ